jgi:hypothetical protein
MFVSEKQFTWPLQNLIQNSYGVCNIKKKFPQSIGSVRRWNAYQLFIAESSVSGNALGGGCFYSQYIYQN